MSKPAKKAALYGWGLVSTLLVTMLLVACSATDKNSTIISLTVRPVTVVAGANDNVSPGSLPTDPTKNPDLVAGATSTPGRATATIPPAAATTASGNTPPKTTAPASGGAIDDAKAMASFRKVCAQCHNNFGAVAGIGKVLTGDYTKDPNNIVTIVRNGRAAMPKFDASQISDADLDNLAKWITNRYHGAK